MSKITLTDLVNLDNPSTAVSAINNNNAVLETASDNTLSRDGTQPNSMNANLDMNSNRILNLPAPQSNAEPARLQDLETLTGSGTIVVNPLPTGGTTSQVLNKISNANFDAGWTTITIPPPYVSPANVYYPTCDITGATDSSAAIQAAVNTAQTAGGGVVQLPATGTGNILINTGVTISKGGITIQGYGYEDFKDDQAAHSPIQRGTTGTYINQTNTANPVFLVLASASNCLITNMAFTQQHAADAPGWTPTAYKACILHMLGSGPIITGGRLEVSRVCFEGVNVAIQAGTAGAGAGTSYAVGRDYYRNIVGTVFSVGIDVQCATDVVRIENLHWWPGYSTIGTNSLAYAQANATGVRMFRCDNPMIQNYFCYGIKIGVRLTSSADGITQGAQFNNLNCDSVHLGIFVDAVANGGQYNAMISNFTHAGVNSAVPGDYAVQVLGTCSGVKLVIENANLLLYNGPAFLIDGTGCDFTLTNASASVYNQAGGGTSPLVSVLSGNTGWLYGRIKGTSINSSPSLGTAGTVTNHADGP